MRIEYMLPAHKLHLLRATLRPRLPKPEPQHSYIQVWKYGS